MINNKVLNIISLGAGVQSSTMALMAAHNEITPMPDAAIFCDTGAEPQYVYRWLSFLKSKLPYPVFCVMKDEGLEKNIIESINGGRFAGVPFFTEPLKTSQFEICSVCHGSKKINGNMCDWCNENGTIEIVKNSSGGMLRRQCTNEFKIIPLIQKIRELLNVKKGERVSKGIKVFSWIGISTDEALRMKPSDKHYIQNIWPLIDKNISRSDCYKWMLNNGYPKPLKSSCYFCPFHSNETWKDLKENHHDEFIRAVWMDKLIRKGVRGTTQKLYLNQKMKPLDQINFNEPSSKKHQVDMFINECSGMCGV